MSSNLNPFAIAQKQLDAAAEKLGLDEATHELLRWVNDEDGPLLTHWSSLFCRDPCGCSN